MQRKVRPEVSRRSSITSCRAKAEAVLPTETTYRFAILEGGGGGPREITVEALIESKGF
jgi:hypothetical protein